LTVEKKESRGIKYFVFWGSNEICISQPPQIASRFVRIAGIVLHQQNMPKGEKQ
jgi:hypothetical protein